MQHMMERRALKLDPGVQAAIKLLWKACEDAMGLVTRGRDEDAHMDEGGYLSLCLAVGMQLETGSIHNAAYMANPQLVKDTLIMAAQDWDRDASRCGGDGEQRFQMHFEHFSESIFELAGTRVRNLVNADYEEFIMALVHGIFEKGDDRGDVDGDLQHLWRWKNPNAMFKRDEGCRDDSKQGWAQDSKQGWAQDEERHMEVKRRSRPARNVWGRAEKYLRKAHAVSHFSSKIGGWAHFTNSWEGYDVGSFAQEVMTMADRHGVANGALTVNELRTYLRDTKHNEFMVWLVGAGKCLNKGEWSAHDHDASGSLSQSELYTAVNNYFAFKKDHPETIGTAKEVYALATQDAIDRGSCMWGSMAEGSAGRVVYEAVVTSTSCEPSYSRSLELGFRLCPDNTDPMRDYTEMGHGQQASPSRYYHI